MGTALGLPEDARAFTARHSLLPEGAGVLALVSGGADSTALLRLLAEGYLGTLTALRVLHVNHLLRGSASDEDAQFVAELCDRLDVPCRIVTYDVAAWAAQEGLNLEDAGRRIRYRFAESELDDLMRGAGVSAGGGRVAVGHTLDDRVETFFMRALSGAGSGGLSSIAPQRGRVVRPLLGSRREDVRAWLEGLAQSWREDESNLARDRMRARIRHDLLPAAAAINTSYRANLARTMDLLGEEDALLQEMADAFAHDFVETRGDTLVFVRHLMLTLSRPMARRTIRSALLRAFPESSRIDYEHVEAIADGLSEDGFARDLPGGLRAVAEYDTIVVARAGEERPCVAPALLPIPGTTDLGPGGVLTAEEVDPSEVSGTADSIVIDATSVRADLVVDAVRPGDRMRPFGMEGTRKLSDLLIDAKVPHRHRSAVPVIRDGDRIVWLAGVRMDEAFRVEGDTRRAVRITWTRPASMACT